MREEVWKGWDARTFEGGAGGDVEGCVVPCGGVFGIATAWSAELVQSGDAVARFDLEDVPADGVDGACDVIALVDGCGRPVWKLETEGQTDDVDFLDLGGFGDTIHTYFPVLLVDTGHEHFDDDLLCLGLGDG